MAKVLPPEAQRIAIAEACGWNVRQGVTHFNIGHGNFVPVSYLPDYLNDLNAMHEAEKVITDWWAYSDHLNEITNTQALHQQDLIRATAAQRAEAFLKCLGKWKQ